MKNKNINILILTIFIAVLITSCNNVNTDISKERSMIEETTEILSNNQETYPKYYEKNIINDLLKYYVANAGSSDVWGADGDYDLNKFHNINEINNTNGSKIPITKIINEGKIIYNNDDSIKINNIVLRDSGNDEWGHFTNYWTINCNIKFENNRFIIMDGKISQATHNPPNEQDKRNNPDPIMMDPKLCVIPIDKVGYNDDDLIVTNEIKETSIEYNNSNNIKETKNESTTETTKKKRSKFESDPIWIFKKVLKELWPTDIKFDEKISQVEIDEDNIRVKYKIRLQNQYGIYEEHIIAATVNLETRILSDFEFDGTKLEY